MRFDDVSRIGSTPGLATLLRWRYAVLGVMSLGLSTLQLDRTDTDWDYFILGSKLLFEEFGDVVPDGGVHLYANYPDVQIGPLSLLLTMPFRLFGSGSRTAAVLTMSLALPTVVYLVERAARIVRERAGLPASDDSVRLTVLAGGIIVTLGWSPLASTFTHLDDALVLAFACVALHAVARERGELAGVALGLAMAAKPWAVVVLPMVLALPGRPRVRAVLAAGGVAAAAWLPFLLGDTGTLTALRPNTPTDPASVLNLLGLPTDQPPDWVRPAQFGTALVLGSLAVRRGRWVGVLVIGIATRIAFDPGVYPYYAAGLYLGALAWDLVRVRAALPAFTVATFMLVGAGSAVPNDTVQALLRLLATAGAITAVLVVGENLRPSRPSRVPDETRQPG